MGFNLAFKGLIINWPTTPWGRVLLDKLSSSSSQDRKVHYCVCKNPPLVPNLNQSNAVHNCCSYFFNIHFIIFLPHIHRFSKLSFFLQVFQPDTSVCVCVCVCVFPPPHAPVPSHPPRFYHSNILSHMHLFHTINFLWVHLQILKHSFSLLHKWTNSNCCHHSV